MVLDAIPENVFGPGLREPEGSEFEPEPYAWEVEPHGSDVPVICYLRESVDEYQSRGGARKITPLYRKAAQ